MKARIKTINEMVNEEVRKHIKKARSDIYDDVAEDIVRQTIACCLFYLDKTFGFREKRLKNVVSGIINFLELKPFGKSLNAVDIMKYLKEEYNIDLDEINIITADETEK